MSSWLVGSPHISALVWAFLEYAPGALDTAQLHGRDGLGQLLMNECRKSVSCDYPSKTLETLPGWGEDYSTPYRYTAPLQLPTLYETYMNFICYEYQSCEHPEWESSLAYQLTTEMLAVLRSKIGLTDEEIRKTQEWAHAPWGWGEG